MIIYLSTKKQKDIDETTKQMDGYEKDYPQTNLSGKTKQNALQHMYIESKVAKFLTKNKNIYDYVIVSNPDYFYLNQLNLDYLQNITEHTHIGTCHHWENADMCTDGFYNNM